MKTYTFFCAHMTEVNVMDCNELPNESATNARISVMTCQSRTKKDAYRRLIGFAEWCDEINFTCEDHLSIMVTNYQGKIEGKVWNVDEEGSPFSLVQTT